MKHDQLSLAGGALRGMHLPPIGTDVQEGQLAMRNGVPAIYRNGQWQDVIEFYNAYDEYMLSVLKPTFYARCRDNANNSVVTNQANSAQNGTLKLVSRADGLTKDAAAARMGMTYEDDRSFFFGGGRYITVTNGLPATFPAEGLSIFIHCQPTYNSSFASQTLFSTGQMEVRIANRSTTRFTFEVRVGSSVTAFGGDIGTFGQVHRLILSIRPGGGIIDIYNGPQTMISGSWWTGNLLPVGTVHFGASLFTASSPQWALHGYATRLAILPRTITQAEAAALAALNGA